MQAARGMVSERWGAGKGNARGRRNTIRCSVGSGIHCRPQGSGRHVFRSDSRPIVKSWRSRLSSPLFQEIVEPVRIHSSTEAGKRAGYSWWGGVWGNETGSRAMSDRNAFPSTPPGVHGVQRMIAFKNVNCALGGRKSVRMSTRGENGRPRGRPFRSVS